MLVQEVPHGSSMFLLARTIVVAGFWPNKTAHEIIPQKSNTSFFIAVSFDLKNVINVSTFKP